MKITRTNIVYKVSLLWATILSSLAFQSCFTGVESTGKITLSKKEEAIIAPTAEEIFLKEVAPAPIKDWIPGKKFLVTDEKLRFILDGNYRIPVSKGDTLVYNSLQSKYSAGGGESSSLIFTSRGGLIGYPLEKKADDAKNNITSSQLSMLIDLDMVEAVNAKLQGKTIWTKSALWYDDDMQYSKGKKYAPVEIMNVLPGDSFFPLLIIFEDREGHKGRYLMNIGNSGNDSRSFSKLFYLNDPRTNYRHITEENWQAIQQEEVRIGMTKEECRLSKGNPSDMDSGHNYSATMEIWKYPDGKILRFVDGVLVSYQ